MKPKVFSYSRFSKPEQARGDSLRRQTDLAEKYAKEHDLELDRTLKADEGLSAYSGANLKKGHLGQFMEKVRGGKVPKGSFLLVESLDRLSREDILEALPLFIEIIKLGVRVVTLCDNQTYDEASIKANPMTLMLSLLTFSRANEESSTKAKRVKAAWSNKRSNLAVKKLTATGPGWLRLNEEKTSFQVIPERGEIVKKMFDLALKGHGNDAISRLLNSEKVPPWGVGKRVASLWHVSYIQKILSNRAVLGEFQPHSQVDGVRAPVGEVIRDYFPALISEEMFNRVQSAKAGRRNQGGRKTWNAKFGLYQLSNLFTHLAFCGRCGGPLTRLDKGKHKKGGIYLACTGATRGTGCPYRSTSYAAFETEVLLYLRELDWGSLTSNAEQDKSELAKLKEEIEGLRLERLTKEKTIAVLLDGIATSGLSPTAVIAKISELEAESANLEKQVKLLEQALQQKSNSLVNAESQGTVLRSCLADGSPAVLQDQNVRAALREQLLNSIRRIDVLIRPEWPEVERFFDGRELPATKLLFPEREQGSCFVSVEFTMGTTRWLMFSRDTSVAQEVLV